MERPETEDAAYTRGAALLARIHGQYGADALAVLDGVAPDLKKWIIEFAFGQVYAREGLDLRSRQLVTISALAALGGADAQLQAHIRGGLNVGLSRTEIVEALMQLALYAGFPRAIHAVQCAKAVFEALDVAGSP